MASGRPRQPNDPSIMASIAESVNLSGAPLGGFY